MAKKDTILIICAHPDDEVLGAGGTIAKYSREGKRVIAAVMSYGEKSHWWMKKRYTVEMRVKESKTAGKMLGIAETVFLGLKDFELKEELSKKRNLALIEKLIRKHSPSKIFTHSPDDLIYSDHAAVWGAVEKVAKKVAYQGDIYVFNVWAKDIRLGQNPKLVVDVSDTFKLKLKALRCFRSQHKYLFQLYPGILWRAFRAGLENHCRFAEIFNKVG
ncbi:PIG-L family deacetylase [archaeon]|nr:PIG-L family deacetylase [archaeon]